MHLEQNKKWLLIVSTWVPKTTHKQHKISLCHPTLKPLSHLHTMLQPIVWGVKANWKWVEKTIPPKVDELQPLEQLMVVSKEKHEILSIHQRAINLQCLLFGSKSILQNSTLAVHCKMKNL